MGDEEWFSLTQASASALHRAQCVAAGMHIAVLFPSCWETYAIGALWEESTESSVRYSALPEAIRRYVVYITQLAHIATCWANQKDGLTSHLSCGSSKPHNSCRVELTLRDKSFRQIWYQMQIQAYANVHYGSDVYTALLDKLEGRIPASNFEKG